MLVISRRENERFLFPNLGIAIQVIKVAGKAAKIGVEAPREIRVLREELLDNSDANPLPEVFAGLEAALPKNLKHDFRNRLNPISLGIQVVQQLIEKNRVDEIEPVLNKVVNSLKKLDGDLLDDSTQPMATQRLAQVLADTKLDDEKLALVVDDNANERSLMTALLELSGYSVVVVEDGQAALDYLEQSFQTPDFVLLDMNMPRKNGAETIVEIRRNPEFKALKVFAVSGSDQDEMNVKVGPEGVNRWFTKPLDARQLVVEMDRELQSA